MSALWCRYCYGETESGKPIAPNDPSWERIADGGEARRASDPHAFLELRDIFGDLAAGIPTYVARVFQRALGALGARRSLDARDYLSDKP